MKYIRDRLMALGCAVGTLEAIGVELNDAVLAELTRLESELVVVRRALENASDGMAKATGISGQLWLEGWERLARAELEAQPTVDEIE